MLVRLVIVGVLRLICGGLFVVLFSGVVGAGFVYWLSVYLLLLCSVC